MASPILNPGLPAGIPRFIENLNAMATQNGMTTEMAVEPYSDDPEVRLWGKWRGTRGQFLALVQPVASYHLPLSRGSLNIPGGSGYYSRNALLSGSVIVNGDAVLFEIDFGSPEFTIANHADVEVVSYAHEVLYHGSPAALLALGIQRSRLPLGKKAVKAEYHSDSQARWLSRRQPDGSVVHRVESPAAFRRRRARLTHPHFQAKLARFLGAESTPPTARPSHLRLVIDNSRGEVPHA
jgi:hypothetical protein